jgi:hypothetical protein
MKLLFLTQFFEIGHDREGIVRVVVVGRAPVGIAEIVGVVVIRRAEPDVRGRGRRKTQGDSIFRSAPSFMTILVLLFAETF